jgi:hypothetical protein
LARLIPTLSNLIATLYVQAAPESRYWHYAFGDQGKVDSYRFDRKEQNN